MTTLLINHNIGNETTNTGIINWELFNQEIYKKVFTAINGNKNATTNEEKLWRIRKGVKYEKRK